MATTSLPPSALGPNGNNNPSGLSLTRPALNPGGGVDPMVLEDAMNKLDSLRLTRSPSSTSGHSQVTSGASSPSGTTGKAGLLERFGGGDAKSGIPGSSETVAATLGRSIPGTPHFGAQTELLKTLDESTKVIRQNANIPSRASSVSGIGAVVEKPDYSEAKIVVAMVGLPARGKSYLSNKLMRYLRWLEYNVEVFNVGQLRRSKARAAAQSGGDKADHTAVFFNHSNEEGNKARTQLASESLEALIAWLKAEGNVGIMDATNSTFERRALIKNRLAREPKLQLLFVESLCNDPAVIATNIALKVQSGDPDYANMSREEAERDFRWRIEEYERVYQSINEPDVSFCRILNVGSQVTINRIEGYLQSRIAFYLMNLHLKPRSIYLSRHGESMYNVDGKIGGDSDLSERGWEYARALPDLVKKNIGDLPLEVWTSTLQRTIQTGSFLPFEKKTWKSLDELDAGVCDGMTYEEIEAMYPEDYEARDDDKFNYRYRGGESYRDVVVRLEPVIMELERQENILIIAHQAILRCLYAYFLALPQEELPYIKANPQIPLHTLIKITPMAYGCHEERYPLPIAAVDTHRPKPNSGHRKNSIPSGGSSVMGHGSDNLEAISRATANTARDYYGDLSSHPMTNQGSASKLGELTTSPKHGSAEAVEAVRRALEKDQDQGKLSPKVAVGSFRGQQ
ncbi:6-phosphofructo-2-kinase/fructose-2,6-bisphosphatase bifunctional enzyme [Kockovaella imperatae]|uniref:fructose-2,6-bisphosphate 2-phosphatase n=1 Tax=Kockovaella imperatae TaxID=4999 RepID=A0A1Y1USU1_9TREE|nr:6-phosphofructo-2-kinase/fructose-2,6-bisphosphatase bifunctional enzyme [Kockovaella imperatae]ORX40594.1 6-phosphofructo-2-kinase/fructose-2,6-bisphosphatase bifunctional enzyme [Kockovaella imperatae]